MNTREATTTAINADVLDDLLSACRLSDNLGLTEGFGHISSRSTAPEYLLITPRTAPGLIREATEFIHYRPAEPSDDQLAQLPPERHIHEQIYDARPDVNAVLRFHGPWTLALSTVVDAVHPTVGYGAYLGAHVPVHADPRLIRTPEAGARLAGTLAAGTAVILRGNGAVSTGTTVREALVRAVWLEGTARAVLQASALGTPMSLIGDEIAAFADIPDKSRQIDRAWAYYCTRQDVGAHQKGQNNGR
ncbi:MULTISPECIES: class II aldolase/adducin family protein [unclassified Nocardioides]|uniref:class II aldolase/adducin family protein n=1 Tax=unclassified Nocardioides TaxID=2615069 RepID=UPI000056F450|nr:MULTISPECIES: class II aldolase/adducin family protein [unclassified Nocardioides]ABL81647.1 class II aldolase/adducin family protein [Nocardioides sp. JS614]